MTKPSAFPSSADTSPAAENASGNYARGYAVIAAIMSAMLLLTLPFAAISLMRSLGVITLALAGN